MKRIILPVLALVSLLGYAKAVRSGWVEGSFQFRESCPEVGETLLHRVSGGVSNYMPMHSIGEALLLDHAGATARRRWIVWSWPLLLLLILAVGRLLGSWTAALAAVALMAFHFRTLPVLEFEEVFYAPLLAIVAGAVVYRARSRARWTAFALAVAIGASLLYRSVLFALPPLLACLELRRPRDVRAPLTVGLGPYLFLLPWICLNFRVLHRFVPFEAGSADLMIVTAALGWVSPGEIDWRSLFVTPPKSAALWAAGEIARHPIRYLIGYAARAWFVFHIRPLLILAALGAFWVCRRRPGHQALAVFAFYGLAAHCLITVTEPYLLPWWPLLIVLAASLLAAVVKDSAWERAWSATAAKGILAASLVAASGLAGYSLLKVSALAAYLPDAASDDARLSAEITGRQDDPWLFYRRGSERLVGRRWAQAEDDLVRAYRLRPAEPLYSFYLARAQALQGRPERLFGEDVERAPMAKNGLLQILQAEAYLREGDVSSAKRRRCEARSRWVSPSAGPELQVAQDGRFSEYAARELSLYRPADAVAERVVGGGRGLECGL